MSDFDYINETSFIEHTGKLAILFVDNAIHQIVRNFGQERNKHPEKEIFRSAIY